MRRLSPSELYKAVLDGHTIANHDMRLYKEGDHAVLQGEGFVSGDIQAVKYFENSQVLMLYKRIKWPTLDETEKYLDVVIGSFSLSGGYLIEEADE